MKKNGDIDRISVEKAIRATYDRIRESLGKAGYRSCWQSQGGGHDIECYAGGRLGVIIVQRLRDNGSFLAGVEVYAPLVHTNSIQDTISAIEGKPSQLEQSVDALLAGVSSSQNEKVDRMLRDADYVESHKNQFTMLPVLYDVLVRLIKARRPQ